MSQEKIRRNKAVYKDRLKGLSYRKLSDKWGLAVSVLQNIVNREFKREQDKRSISNQ